MPGVRLAARVAAVLVVLAAWSCAPESTAPSDESAVRAGVPIASDSAVLAPADSAALLGRLPLLGSLLTCEPLPAARVAQAIGPEGGVLWIGPHRLVVPRGALTRTVTLTAEIRSERVNSVDFGPDGLRFERPVALTMSYANCPLVRNILPKRIAYTSDALRILALLRSFDNLLARQVTAPVDHFSRYAIAW